MAELVRAASVPYGGVFKMDDGSIMMKLMNPELRPLENVNDANVWAADVGNGQICKTIHPLEWVEVLG